MTHFNPPPNKNFDEFKAHLLRRHRQNHARRQSHPAAPPPADARTGRLGRYLRAARLNAGLSPAALGRRAKLPPDTILALEQGLILSQDIKTAWLKRLAAALNVNTDDLALLLGDKHQRRRARPALKWGGFWNNFLQAVRLPRTVYMPLLASLLAVVISAAMLTKVGLLLSPGSNAVPYNTAPASSFAPQNTPIPLLISASAHLNPASRLSLLKAERLKVAPAVVPAAASLPPVVEANKVTYLFINSKLNTAPPEPRHRIQIFFDIVYWLTAGPRLQLEGRPNITSAEFGLENQIWVQPKIININSENRLNMVKAEVKL